jgi:aminopeptidase-like protein
MGLTRLFTEVDFQGAGREMHALMERLYPICRSITGQGIRDTFAALGGEIPLEVRRVPSGTPVFDWTVPREWNLRDAYIKDARGVKVVDLQRSSLHVVGYSAPVRERMQLRDLRPHLHSLPEHPDWVPYRASYYRENWGFCLTHRQLESLEDGEYEVVIDSTLEDGHLDYAECVVEGREAAEVLISAHACHPSLCNDNLSGVVLSTWLARLLAERRPRFTYRFVFIPTIIGSITWLARNEARAGRIRHGLVVTCVGDAGAFTYKRSRRGDADIDRAAAHVLRHSGFEHEVIDFFPYGYDERNYCSPGFDLPVGSLSRTTHGRFPEYHTSADNLDFVRPQHLAESLQVYLRLLETLENDGKWLNTNPKCEPQLGRRGLYNVIGGLKSGQTEELAMFWVLNQCDGRHSLLDIAERSGIAFDTIAHVADRLAEHGLLIPARS